MDTQQQQQQQKQIFLPAQLYNANILSYYRDISCLVMGSACGILQLKAINGLLFFIIASLLSGMLFQISMVGKGNNFGEKDTINDFYSSPIKDIYFGDIGRQVATFTMMWCLLGALVSY